MAEAQKTVDLLEISTSRKFCPNTIHLEESLGEFRHENDLKKELADKILQRYEDNLALKLLYDAFFLLTRYGCFYEEKKREMMDGSNVNRPEIHLNEDGLSFHWNNAYIPYIKVGRDRVQISWADDRKVFGWTNYMKCHQGPRKILLTEMWNKFLETESCVICEGKQMTPAGGKDAKIKYLKDKLEGKDV